MIEISNVKHKYFYLFADCQLVKGYTRTMLCDISRGNSYFIDNSYYALLTELKEKSIGEVSEMLEDADSYQQFEMFVNDLLNKEIGEIVDDLGFFPDIEIKWDHPSPVTNAIIDIRDVAHDFQSIFQQLADLYCEHLQIRSYSILPFETIKKICFLVSGTNLRSLEFILPFSKANSDDLLMSLVNEFTFSRFIVHSTPEWFTPMVLSQYRDRVIYIEQQISSCEACGIINTHSFSLTSIQNFMENTLFNGCLNRKISIDETGEIKNCPSMKTGFGNINDTSLNAVIDQDEFKRKWLINKDHVNICSDCEYRRVCSDCRAYTINDNPYSKPSKCTYDPFSGVWESQSQFNFESLIDLSHE
jgi:SPASM domain peptide maturase of grasp-with-spasm system